MQIFFPLFSRFSRDKVCRKNRTTILCLVIRGHREYCRFATAYTVMPNIKKHKKVFTQEMFYTSDDVDLQKTKIFSRKIYSYLLKMFTIEIQKNKNE